MVAVHHGAVEVSQGRSGGVKELKIPKNCYRKYLITNERISLFCLVGNLFTAFCYGYQLSSSHPAPKEEVSPKSSRIELLNLKKKALTSPGAKV